MVSITYLISPKLALILFFCLARLIQNEKATSNNDEIEKQRWLIDPEGYIHIFSDPNLVIDIRGAEDKDGAEIILYEKRGGNASSNQRWRLEPAHQ